MASTDQAGLKRAILEVSLQLGTELGEEGLTMRAIARRLGVSATALYQHFDSKASILRAIRFDGLGKLHEYLDPAFESGSPWEQLRDHAVRYLAFARDNPWLYSVLTEGDEVGWENMSEGERASVAHSSSQVMATLEAGRADGTFRADLDPKVAPQMLWAALHGFALLLLKRRVVVDDPAFAGKDHDVVDAFVDGLMRTILR